MPASSHVEVEVDVDIRGINQESPSMGLQIGDTTVFHLPLQTKKMKNSDCWWDELETVDVDDDVNVYVVQRRSRREQLLRSRR